MRCFGVTSFFQTRSTLFVWYILFLTLLYYPSHSQKRHEEEMHRRKEAQRQNVQKTRTVMYDQMSEKEKARQRQLELEAAEEERIQQYLADRDRTLVERKRAAEAAKAKSVEQREQILQKLSREQAAQVNTEEARIQAVVEERARREREQAEAKERKRKQMLDSIFEHRNMELERRAKERKALMAADKAVRVLGRNGVEVGLS